MSVSAFATAPITRRPPLEGHHELSHHMGERGGGVGGNDPQISTWPPQQGQDVDLHTDRVPEANLLSARRRHAPSKKGRTFRSAPLSCSDELRSVVHVAHPAHPTTRRHRRALLLRPLGHHRLGGHQQPSHRCRILQRRPHHLGRINDARLYQVLELAGLRVKAPVVLVPVEDLAGDHRPSSPAFSAIWRSGVCTALRTISMPKRWSSLSALSLDRISEARASGTPPPATTPSSTAARVACSASSTRSLRSFTSTSEAPPTRITATPPASFAKRSCSFSRS